MFKEYLSVGLAFDPWS